MPKSNSKPKTAAADVVPGDAQKEKKLKPAAGKRGKQSVKKAKPEKVVRHRFTMPKSDYRLIRTLKNKCLEFGVAAKKSELLRAGLAALASLPGENLTQAVQALVQGKTGRPGNTKRKKQ